MHFKVSFMGCKDPRVYPSASIRDLRLQFEDLCLKLFTHLYTTVDTSEFDAEKRHDPAAMPIQYNTYRLWVRQKLLSIWNEQKSPDALKTATQGSTSIPDIRAVRGDADHSDIHFDDIPFALKLKEWEKNVGLRMPTEK